MSGLMPPMLVPVAVGGAAGAVLRHWVGHAVAVRWPEHAHGATMAVNVVGSVVLGGVAAYVYHRPGVVPREVELGLGVGLIGAFTTYSAFATDFVRLMDAGRVGAAAVYVVGTLAACLAGAGGAFGLVRWLVGGTSG